MPRSPILLGLQENLGQFSLLVLVNAFVGAMVGLERSILPAVAQQEFHIAARAAILSFIVVFGVTKALTNYLAGRLSDRYGRKHVLVAGWLVAVPVPFLLMWGPGWNWVVAANVLLGVSQGLTWSTTVIMKIDLVGPRRRGLAMGLNEFSGYFAVAASALATGWIAAHYGLRPQPFSLGVAYVAIGLALFVPWGLTAATTGPRGLVVGIVATTLKLGVTGAALALIETASAKLRIFRAPEFLATAFLFAVLGLLVHQLLGS